MFTLQQFLKLQLFQLQSYNWPEWGWDIPEPLERSPRPPKRPDSLEGVAAEVGHEASTATTEQAQFWEAAERLNPNTVTWDWGVIPVTSWEWVDEWWEQASAEWEHPLSPELREELIDDMTEEERADFESKTPEEQQEYLENLNIRQGEMLFESALEIAEELGIEGFWEWWEDGEADLEQRLNQLSPEEKEAFQNMSLEEQREFIRWLYAEELAQTIEVINQALEETERRIDQGWLWEAENRALRQRAQALRGMQWAVWWQPGWTPWVWQFGWEQGFYRWGIGEPLTPELLAEYGSTWYELASWLQQNNFPIYNWRPNLCGLNVWEALNNFGIEWLPTYGRDGYRWASFMAERPTQFKQINTTLQDAPAWAIISYNRWVPWWSQANFDFWHVEIALWSGRWYYFGTVSETPGWSNENPPAGSYQIFMPISKTA